MEQVRVVPYDPSWPDRYAEAADELRAALAGELRTIEHVGSTAVPGLVAKPVIDIAVSVESLRQLDVQALEALGYRLRPRVRAAAPRPPLARFRENEERMARILERITREEGVTREQALRRLEKPK